MNGVPTVTPTHVRNRNRNEFTMYGGQTAMPHMMGGSPSIGIPFGGPTIYHVTQPMPMPMPMPMNPYPYGGFPQQGPTVVIINQREEPEEDPPKPEPPKPEPPKPEPPKPEPPKPEPKPDVKKPEPPTPKRPPKDEMSPLGISSVIIFVIGFIMGIVCIAKTEQAHEAIYYEEDNYMTIRNTALASGAIGIACMAISTILAFIAGITHKLQRKVEGSGCCVRSSLIAAWIFFGITFVCGLVVLVLGFAGNTIHIELVTTAFIGCVVSWVLMFGWSEMTRRA